MRYREYGKTGKMVSLLGFGTSRFRPEDYATEAGREKLINLLVKAHCLGVNYFDTWHDYGNGQCEALLGHAFKRMQGDFYLATKSHNSQLDACETRKRLEASLRHLQVEKIHFYHLWCILHMDHFRAYTRKGGPYEGALRAKNEGLIDHICFSAHCDGKTIAKIASSGLFEGVMLGYNIINFKYREEGLRAAAKAGLGVAVMNPLGGGALPRNAQAFSFAVLDGETIADVALNFCAADATVSVTLSGMTNEKELESNINSVEKLEKFSEQRMEELKSKITEEFNFLCNGCRYCDNCPNDIDIPAYMLSYTNYILHEYNPRAFFEGIGNWRLSPHEPLPCSHCGQCEEKCSQHIPIRKHIDEINMLIEQREKYLREGLERCFGGKDGIKIGLYGAGAYAREMLAGYAEYKKMYGWNDVELIIFDSNPEKIGKTFSIHISHSPHIFHKPCIIHGPEDLSSEAIGRLIIASEDHYQAMHEMVSKYVRPELEIVNFTLGRQYKKLPQRE